jgi:Spy/CpxP family protein refolding chaperone
MRKILAVLTLALCASAAMAQGTAPTAPPNEDDAILIAQAGGAPEAMQDRQPGPPGEAPMAPGGGMKRRGPMKFWNNSEIATKINLTDQQKQQLETAFTNYRLKLIDQRAAVEREEVKLEPLVRADKLDEGAITRQIDTLISARGQLERTTAMMGIEIRKVLSTEQWKQLKELGGGTFGVGAFGGGPERRERMRQEFRGRRDHRGNDGPPAPQGDDKGPK